MGGTCLRRARQLPGTRRGFAIQGESAPAWRYSVHPGRNVCGLAGDWTMAEFRKDISLLAKALSGQRAPEARRLRAGDVPGGGDQ